MNYNVVLSEPVYVVSSRLQPMHLGHYLFWRKVASEHKNKLLICIIANPESTIFPTHEVVPCASFTTLGENNPIPLLHRVNLAKLAINSDAILNNKTTVIGRPHPGIDWKSSLENLPNNRVFVFNSTKSDFDSKKIEFYKSKGEPVIDIPMGLVDDYDGLQIRENLRRGNFDLTFLPVACRAYFKHKCLQYFRGGAHGQNNV